MLNRIYNKRTESAVYGLFLAAAVLYALLFGGFTNLSIPATQRLSRIGAAMNVGIYLLGVLCVLLEMAHSWPRALLAGLLLALRWNSPLSWQKGMLLDTVLLAVLSDLGTEKSNGVAWLAPHIVYIPLLLIFLRLGWTHDFLMEDRKGFLFFTLRHSLGMSHPNNFAILFMSTCMIVWTLFLPKRWWITGLFFWVGALVMYAITMCRTVAALMVGFPFVFMALEGISRSKGAKHLRLLAAVPLLVFAVTVCMGLIIDTLQQVFPDAAFWLRFSDLSILKKDGLMLFGASPSEFGYFDNLYLWLPMYCGLIPTLGVLALYVYMLYALAGEKRTALLAAALVFSVYGLMENAVAYSVYFFVPMLAFAGKKKT